MSPANELYTLYLQKLHSRYSFTLVTSINKQLIHNLCLEFYTANQYSFHLFATARYQKVQISKIASNDFNDLMIELSNFICVIKKLVPNKVVHSKIISSTISYSLNVLFVYRQHCQWKNTNTILFSPNNYHKESLIRLSRNVIIIHPPIYHRPQSIYGDTFKIFVKPKQAQKWFHTES